MSTTLMSWDRTDCGLSLRIGHRREAVPALVGTLLLRRGGPGLTDDPVQDLLRLDLDLECYARHLASGVADAAEEIAFGQDALTLAEGEGRMGSRRNRRLAWEYLGRAAQLYMRRYEGYRCVRRWIDQLHGFVLDLAVSDGPLADAASRWSEIPRSLAETTVANRVTKAARPVAGGGRVAAWVAVGGAALLLAGCTTASHAVASTSAHRSVTRTTTTAPPSTVPSPVLAAQRQALAAYRGMWAAFVAAGQTSDWRSAQLSRYATGLALTNLARSLYTDHANGLVTKGQPLLSPRVSSAIPSQDPFTVIVTDCGDSTHWLKHRADTGALVDDAPGGRHLINAVVQRQSDGTWKVSDYGVQDVGTC